MRVTIVYEGQIPAVTYGGIQRSIWYLGKALKRMGHDVSYLVGADSHCDFAAVKFIDRSAPIGPQIPRDTDVAHICNTTGLEMGEISVPYLINLRTNIYDDTEFDLNTVFISKNHAMRYGSEVFVYNGMEWDDYGPVQLDNARHYFHFLGKGAWRIKNLNGAISVIKKTARERLHVLGGNRINFNMGFRLTLSMRITFHGMVGGAEKSHLLQGSKGLVLPVIWDEPFGNAMTESLYFGCPVFGTPYGSQPEIVTTDVGFLSNDSTELAAAVENVDDYSRTRCHEYARDVFNSDVTARAYLEIYEQLLNGETLNPKPPRMRKEFMTRKLPWK